MADSEKYEYDVHISKYNLNGCWNSGGEAGLGYILEPTTIPLGLDDTGGDCVSCSYFEWITRVTPFGQNSHTVVIPPYRDILDNVDHDIDFNL